MKTPERGNWHGVILAGGSGTRLWPLSTKNTPKQFLSLGARETLMQQTAGRLVHLLEAGHIWVVCGKNHADSIGRHVPMIPRDQILVEPQSKNTAAALALAAVQLEARDPEALMMVLPADHLILSKDGELFARDLTLAAEIARREQALVTFGIPPLFPATGFGYLERGDESQLAGRPYFEVKAFHEKPDLATAQRYLERGGFFWNSGMFVWQVRTFLQELKRCRPELHARFQQLSEAIGSSRYPELLEKVFSEVENISVDYAVMEKARKVLMVPASFAWDDVGNLEALTKVLPRDESGNFSQGEMFGVEAQNNLVVAGSKPVALVGVEDLVVIDAPQAVLVLPRKRAQEVKKMVEYLKEKGREDLI